MDDAITGKIAAKVTALLNEVFTAGIKEGRDLERQDIVASLSGAGRARAKSPSAPAANQPYANGGLTTAVANALSRLRESNPDGVLPDTLTNYVQANGSEEVSPRDIRQALRHMTLQGQARRVQGGRYMPVEGDLFERPDA